mmetsp:Transcript_7103/g.24606  ORF Transcript_7103/g.24606 Transcript_7103/m.24606 type:complete len:272 (-) Transcript_7103:813-1628(-)
MEHTLGAARPRIDHEKLRVLAPRALPPKRSAEVRHVGHQIDLFPRHARPQVVLGRVVELHELLVARRRAGHRLRLPPAPSRPRGQLHDGAAEELESDDAHHGLRRTRHHPRELHFHEEGLADVDRADRDRRAPPELAPHLVPDPAHEQLPERLHPQGLRRPRRDHEPARARVENEEPYLLPIHLGLHKHVPAARPYDGNRARRIVVERRVRWEGVAGGQKEERRVDRSKGHALGILCVKDMAPPRHGRVLCLEGEGRPREHLRPVEVRPAL